MEGEKVRKKLIKRSARLYLDQDVIKIRLSSLASNPSAPNHLEPLYRLDTEYKNMKYA